MRSRKEFSRHWEQLDLPSWNFTTLAFCLRELQTDFTSTGQYGTFLLGGLDSVGKVRKGKKVDLKKKKWLQLTEMFSRFNSASFLILGMRICRKNGRKLHYCTALGKLLLVAILLPVCRGKERTNTICFGDQFSTSLSLRFLCGAQDGWSMLHPLCWVGKLKFSMLQGHFCKWRLFFLLRNHPLGTKTSNWEVKSDQHLCVPCVFILCMVKNTKSFLFTVSYELNPI